MEGAGRGQTVTRLSEQFSDMLIFDRSILDHVDPTVKLHDELRGFGTFEAAEGKGAGSEPEDGRDRERRRPRGCGLPAWA